MFNNLSSSEHSQNLVLSYVGIRRAIGILGFFLPIILFPFGWILFGIEIQDNMSSYYHTSLRDVFVGIMCAIGIFLFCYRGYDFIESWTGNLGCVSAIGVALFPLDANSDPLHQSTIVGYLHTLCGGCFFLTLAFYSLYHFPRNSFNVDLKTLEGKRDAIYLVSGITILLSMLAMGAYLFLLSDQLKGQFAKWNFLFWMEWIAVWAFSMAWLTKGHAILANMVGD